MLIQGRDCVSVRLKAKRKKQNKKQTYLYFSLKQTRLHKTSAYVQPPLPGTEHDKNSLQAFSELLLLHYLLGSTAHLSAVHHISVLVLF